MAELAIKIDPGSGYEDGDILCAFNGRRIRCCHAQHICHVRISPRNAGGLILPDAVSRDWFEATHQYRFERVSATEIVRFDLIGGKDEVFSDKPNERGEQIDVRLFIARRKRQPQHYLFGEDGAEFWYGGKVDTSDAKLFQVWTAIEAKTPHREASFRRWPAGTRELRSHLFLAVDDFDDAIAADLESPDVELQDGERIVHAKRLHKLDWATKVPAEEIARIRDKSQEVDLREVVAPLTRRNVIERKPQERRDVALDHSPR